MKRVGRKSATRLRKFDPPRSVETPIAALAMKQHGVLSLDQLRECGLGARAVQYRATTGALHRLHSGVYAVGHSVLTREGRWMAAVLACGEGAVLSHRSAAAHLGLRQTSAPSIDVTVPRRAGRSRPGISLHRCRSLAPEDVAVLSGIRTTTVAKTIIDLADSEPRRNVERLMDQAEILRIFDRRELDATLGRANGRRGPGAVRSILSDYAIGEDITRNDVEEAMLAVCLEADLPRPEVNAWIPLDDSTGFEGDFVWRQPKVIAEVDGRASHGSAHAFEWDRARDRKLALDGWRVLRFTRREILMTPRAVVGDLRLVLL